MGEHAVGASVQEIESARDAFSVTATKQRDLEYGAPLTFRRIVVPLETTNKWGKPVTSCVVKEEVIKSVLNEREQAVVEILDTMI